MLLHVGKEMRELLGERVMGVALHRIPVLVRMSSAVASCISLPHVRLPHTLGGPCLVLCTKALALRSVLSAAPRSESWLSLQVIRM